VKVDKGGNLKLTLTDDSVLMVGSESELHVDEAKFGELNKREKFSVTLTLGKVWAHVSKALAGSSQNFEVKTDRAVAGVRGTIFRVDATKMFDQARPKSAARSYTVVRVHNGQVRVDAPRVSAKAQSKAPPQLLAQVGITPESAKKERHRVEPPKQVSLEEWEAKFAELQKRQFVAVGDDLWQQDSWAPESDKDAFAQFVNKNAPKESGE
jgi:FecR protein